jgi:hypothetical protein
MGDDNTDDEDGFFTADFFCAAATDDVGAVG